MDNDGTVGPAGVTRIIGILLVRNEDIYLGRIIANIIDFCDEIIVADNRSVDDTAAVVRSLQKIYPRIRYHSIDHPGESQDLIAGYAGTPAWIFAVDGDELYDPGGLAVLRRKLLQGEHDDRWMILGNVLHCLELDLTRQEARGYLSPPSRSMTKLYNFARIVSWDGPCPERLHGGTVRFQPGCSGDDRYHYHEKTTWDQSIFRCLHLCFLPRSSSERKGQGPRFRENISEKNSRNWWKRILGFWAGTLGGSLASQYKREKYMRGAVVAMPVDSFFPGDDLSTSE